MRLADFILENMEPILVEWEDFARSIQPAEGNMNVAELRDHAEEMLRTIAADLATSQSEAGSRVKSRAFGSKQFARDAATDTAAETHADKRLESGFSVNHLVSEFRALRASVLSLWLQGKKDATPTEVEDIIRFNESVDQALGESAARYSHADRQAQDIFLGILGHDLRTPLQSLSMGAQVLMRSEKSDSMVIQLGSRMFNSAARMKGMLDNLLDLTTTRIGSGIQINPAHADLAVISEQVAEEYRASNPGRKIHNQPSGDCGGYWDASRIGQIYQNLIGNALQYGSADGEITVSTCCSGPEAVITVHNHGQPIPPDQQLRIFDLLRRNHGEHRSSTNLGKNLGLGLYIAREIAIAHLGSIDVASSQEEGTTFTVRLPKNIRAEEENLASGY